MVNQWPNGFLAEVVVTNIATTPINGWTVAWSFPGDQQITNLWNGAVTQAGANVSVRNAPWNGTIRANGTVNFGFLANFSGTNVNPTGLTCGAASP
jgi:cellulase/cellobiase CelA1